MAQSGSGLVGAAWYELHAIKSLVDLLRFRAEHQSSRLIYSFWLDDDGNHFCLTYEELDRRARNVASRLRSIAREGQCVLILTPPGFDFVTAFWGCLYAGMIAVPALPVHPKRLKAAAFRLQQIARDAQCDIVITTSSLTSIIQGNLSGHACVVVNELKDDDAKEWRRPDIDGQAIAILQYTSGSTTAPRGVVLTHANLLNNSALIQRRFEHTEETRGMSWLPPYHDLGLIGGIVQPVYVGFPVLLMPAMAFLQKPVRWLRAIATWKATSSGGPNFAYELCATKVSSEQLDGVDLRCWELAFSGAEPVNPGTMQRFARKFEAYGFRWEAFFPCYGLAESTLLVSAGPRSAPTIIGFSRSALEKGQVMEAVDVGDRVDLVACGEVTDNPRVVIVDPEECIRRGPGLVGEIWLSGDGVGLGYRHQADETARTFRARIRDSEDGPFLRTGDLGFICDKQLFITGRLKDIIVVAGRNFYPQDLEFTAERSHSGLQPSSGAAFSVQVDENQYLLVAFELTRHALSMQPEKIISSVRAAISAEHGVTADGILLLRPGTIPKTTSGKIQRHACRTAFLSHSLNVVAHQQSPALERSLGTYHLAASTTRSEAMAALQPK